MDILTCLLFFVLKSFVAGGEVTVPPPGLTLPASTAERPQATSLVIAIEKDAIFLGGERVALGAARPRPATRCSSPRSPNA